MANERTLVERLINPDLRVGRSSRDRREHLAASVVGHLTRLLNSRQGCSSTLSDYGMPDFSESQGSKNEMKAAFELAIRTTIQKYEPRLRRVVVRLDEDEGQRLDPRFTITAELATTDDSQRQVSFSSVMDANGKISIW
jgi:type VI secretion system protein